MKLKINEKTAQNLETIIAQTAKKKRGRPKKNNPQAENNSALIQKNINIGGISYFTNVIDQQDDIFTVKFTNVKDDPRPLIEWFNAEFRKLCNRLQKQRPYIPYAGYRIIEHTQKDPIIFGSCNKTQISVTAIGAQFIYELLKMLMPDKPPRRVRLVEIFFKETAKKPDIRKAKITVLEMGLADKNLLRELENLPRYCRAESRHVPYLVYMLLRLIDDKLECIKTATKIEIGNIYYQVVIDVQAGNYTQSIGVDYGVTGFHYRTKQTFGRFYGGRQRRRTKEDIEIDKIVEERKLQQSAQVEIFTNPADVEV